jgi:hypothetical protein
MKTAYRAEFIALARMRRSEARTLDGFSSTIKRISEAATAQ